MHICECACVCPCTHMRSHILWDVERNFWGFYHLALTHLFSQNMAQSSLTLYPSEAPRFHRSSYFLFPEPWHLSSHACELTFFLLNFHSFITSSRVALAETSPICPGWHGSALLTISIPLYVYLCGGQLFFTIPGGSYFQKDTLENKGHILFFFVSLVLRQYLAL